MSVYGIISEFNPFHNGHKYLIDTARARGAEAVVCVMSGNAVQRGECAVADKYIRAEMALAGGADLVLELPYPWSAASAEFFAACGVNIASAFADTIFFGSELGDIDALSRAAEICSDEGFAAEYKEKLAGNAGTAGAYFDILERRTGRKYSSNDILGIEYIKAARRQGSAIGFETLKRLGASYNDGNIVEGERQSATAIRGLIYNGDTERLCEYMPSECARILLGALERGELTNTEKINQAVRLFFRLHNPLDFVDIADIDEGIASRICSCASDSSEGELIESLRTKRYTDARLRRAILFCMTGVKRSDIATPPAYVNLLGANSVGRELLSRKRKESPIEVIAKQADIPLTPAANRQFELSVRLDEIFSLSMGRSRNAAYLIRKSPVIKE
ncbi:MAG: nucleotidyltransferase family protein [Clostridia bacterium]|nr:nucleotidyltransferase family protein [Clostridia bacterium]